MREQLIEMIGKPDLIGLHRDSDEPTRFAAGWVSSIGDDWGQINTVDEHGRFDECVLFRLTDVIQVSKGGPYLDALQHKTSLLPGNAEKPSIKFGSLEELLAATIKTRSIITITDHSWIATYCRIVQFESDWINFQEYSISGIFDGDSVILLDNVRMAEFGGIRERMIECIASAQDISPHSTTGEPD
jgi:hypothetical protein